MANFVTYENLNPEQIARVNEYIDKVEEYGVVVGAITNPPEWDLKPLVLISGSLKLIRVHDPELGTSRKHSQAFARHITKLLEFGFDYRQKDGRVYLVRDFLQTTLADLINTTKLEKLSLRSKIVFELCKLVQDNFSAGVVHGHICADNLAIDDGNPILLDYCARAFSASSYRLADNMAPEVAKGAIPTESADVYGLAQIIQLLLKNDIDSRQTKIFEAMLDPNPFARPDIAEIIDAFNYSGNDKLIFSQKEALKDLPEVEIPTRRRQPTMKIVLNQGQSIEEKLKWLEGTVALDRQMIEKLKISIQESDSEVTLVEDLLNMPKLEPVLQRDHRIKRDPTPKDLVPVSASREVEIHSSIAAVQAQVPQESNISINRILQLLLVIIVCFILTAAAAFLVLQKKNQEIVVPKPVIKPEVNIRSDLKDLWSTGLASRMQEVAKLAIQGDQQAELLIIKDVLAGGTPVNVNKDFLKIAYDSRWEQYLSKEDRSLAMAYATMPLTGEKPAFPADQKVYPGIILAFMVSNPELSQTVWKETKLEPLYTLPNPIGLSFQKLTSVIDSKLGSPVALALAGFWFNESSSEKLNNFFANAQDLKTLLGLIKIFRETPTFNQANAKQAYKALLNNKKINSISNWFEQNTSARWELVSDDIKFDMFSGTLPVYEFSFQQLSDLIRFPITSVAEAAKSKVLSESPDINEALLSLLDDSDQGISRTQLVSLLYAFKLTGDQQLALISAWFSSNPPPEIVIKLVLARQSRLSIDGFTLEAARYLKDKKWQASSEQYEKLVQNSEELIRALVYAKLDPDKAFDRDLLQKMSEREPSKSLRERLKEKLNN